MSNPESYLSSATRIFQHGFDNFLTHGASLVAKKATANTSQDIISSGTHIIIRSQAEETYSFLKKLIGISFVSATVFGSAFYFGYNLAKNRHRFNVREADKNDQVTKKRKKKFA